MSEMAQSREEILALLRVFMARNRSVYRLVSLGIFGSYARGEAQSDSDVDVVFETDEPNLFRTARMKAELEELLSRRVDVVRLRKQMNPRLRKRILQEVHYV